MEQQTPDGTYAAVKYSDKTNKAVNSYIERNKIPNPTDPDDIHTTLLFSRKFLSDYKPAGEYDQPIVGHPKGIEVWDSEDSDGNPKKILVLTIDSPELVDRHNYLMDKHQATYDFDEYKPHITLSYNLGDFDTDSLEPFEDELEITEEYAEDLDLS